MAKGKKPLTAVASPALPSWVCPHVVKRPRQTAALGSRAGTRSRLPLDPPWAVGRPRSEATAKPRPVVGVLRAWRCAGLCRRRPGCLQSQTEGVRGPSPHSLPGGPAPAALGLWRRRRTLSLQPECSPLPETETGPSPPDSPGQAMGRTGSCSPHLHAHARSLALVMSHREDRWLPPFPTFPLLLVATPPAPSPRSPPPLLPSAGGTAALGARVTEN